MKNILYKDLKKSRNELQFIIKNKAGVYQLVNLTNNKTYVGSSVNLLRRIDEYLNPQYITRNLKKGNSQILNALLKYGYANFGLIILDIIELEPSKSKLQIRNIILSKEQYFLDLIKPDYNINNKAGSNLGRIYGADVRTKMSLAKKGRIGNKLGKSLSNESKVLLRESSGRVTAINMLNENNEKIATFKSIQIASEFTGISRNRISRCARGLRKVIIEKGHTYTFEYVKNN